MMMTILKREMQMVMKLLKIGTVFHLLTRLLAISTNLGCIACKKTFRFFECFVNPNKAFKTASSSKRHCTFGGKGRCNDTLGHQ